MRKLFQTLYETVKAGDSAVLVSTVSSRGSVPRGSGAHMLVTGSGRAAGTIGGGEAEFRAEQAAIEALRAGENATRKYVLRQNEEDSLDSVCGGDIEVFFRYIKGGDAAILSLCERIDRAFEGNSACRLILELTERDDGLIGVYSAEEGCCNADIPAAVTSETSTVPKIIEAEGKRYYTELIVLPGKVYIFGGGHVSQRLVPCLSSCDFRCVILEDRPEFIDPALFGGLADTRLVDMGDLSGLAAELTPDDFVCIMTRGHRHDYESVYYMLRSRACYIGVIGSRTKIGKLRERLIGDGFTEEDLKRLTTPIGIEIYSETPAEIAVSVTAQLIMVRALKNGSRKAQKGIDGGNR